MSGFAMGSVLVNYYRKRDDSDDHIPRVSFWGIDVAIASSH